MPWDDGGAGQVALVGTTLVLGLLVGFLVGFVTGTRAKQIKELVEFSGFTFAALRTIMSSMKSLPDGANTYETVGSSAEDDTMTVHDDEEDEEDARDVLDEFLNFDDVRGMDDHHEQVVNPVISYQMRMAQTREREAQFRMILREKNLCYENSFVPCHHLFAFVSFNKLTCIT